MFPPGPQGAASPGQVQARAIHQYTAAQAGDLSFEPGDIIYVLSQEPSGWWLGRSQDGRQGVFPYNRVQIIPSGPAKVPPRPIPAPVMTDRINQVSVVPVDPIPPSGQKFVVDIYLSNNKNISAEKKMKDFRSLNVGLNMILKMDTGIGPFSKSGQEDPNSIQEIPEWADEMIFPRGMEDHLTRERGLILTKFLEHVIGNNQTDFLVAHWLNPSADFNTNEQIKHQVRGIFDNAVGKVRNAPKPPTPTMAKANYVWTRQTDQEINLQKGEVVAYVIDSEFQGWWNGTKINGATGIFPHNYVAQLDPQQVQSMIDPASAPKRANGGGSSNIILPPSPQPVNPAFGGMMTNPLSSGGFGGEMVNQNLFKATESKEFTSPGTSKEPRARQKIEKYGLKCSEAFDELLTDGITIECNNQWAKLVPDRDCPQVGDEVTIEYSGFIWEPQKQQLLEFASSDKLISNKADDPSAGPLVFTIGQDMAIDGVERAATRMKLKQSVRVTLSPEMAYGSAGDPPDIPGNAYLVYDLTLTGLKKSGKSRQASNNNNGARRAPVRPLDNHNQPSRGFMGAQSTRQMNQNVSSRAQNRNVNQGGQRAGVGPDHFKKQLTLEKLQSIVRNNQYVEYGIEIAIIEEYLTDAEFTRAFNTNRQFWLLMPAYQRAQRKREAGLG